MNEKNHYPGANSNMNKNHANAQARYEYHVGDETPSGLIQSIIAQSSKTGGGHP